MLLEGRQNEVGSLYDSFVRQIMLRELPITDFARSQTLHIPLEEYRAAVDCGKRTRAAAFELALKSGRAYSVGDVLSYYIAASGNRNAPLFERAKPISDWDPNNRDEDVAYYLGQLDKRAALFSDWAPHHLQTCLPFS
jgi:DNA polymerase, archaea type